MRYVLIAIGLVALIIIGVGLYIVVNPSGLLKQSIETYGPSYLGTGVRVQSVDLSFADGTGEILGFEIDNPVGFEGPYAIQMERIEIALADEDTGSNVIALKEISIDGARVRAVAEGTKTNLQKLLQNVRDNVGEPADVESGSEEAEAEEQDLRFMIDRLHFTNAHTQIVSDILGEVAVNVPDVHLRDVGRDTDGATIDEVLGLLLKPVTRAIAKEIAASNAGVEELEEKLKARDRQP